MERLMEETAKEWHGMEEGQGGGGGGVVVDRHVKGS